MCEAGLMCGMLSLGDNLVLTIVQPAIKLARSGFPAHPYLGGFSGGAAVVPHA